MGLPLRCDPRKASLALLAVALSCCLAQGRRYRSSDDQDRSCVRDDDCELYESCQELWCRPAEGCNSCVELPHASAICFHGACLVEACEEGGHWHDADGYYENGCEYECDITAGGVEACDDLDNDCDGRTDEDFDTNYDPQNCGTCGFVCPGPAHAQPLCAGGECYFMCEPGFYDNDGLPDNGCEADFCEITANGEELCDLRDNDCDGTVDEGIAKDTVESCGPLCQQCVYENADGLCEDDRCVMVGCHQDCYDLNQDAADGCEYCCEVTNGGVETCDEIDNDCDGLTDEGLTCTCPDGMVAIDSLYCMDVYEASRPDATSQSPGANEECATSRPDVIPWSNLSLTDASAACQAAGKRLCTPAEWEQACRGPGGYEYTYGDTYDPIICNGIDTFCNCGSGSACESIDPCPFPHCFGQCGASQHVEPTGSFPDCTNAYGLFDINGNLWERVQGGEHRGGAYNCLNSENLHKCGYIPGWGPEPRSNGGFRCCCVQCPQQAR